MSLHFKINPPVFGDVASRGNGGGGGKVRPVFFDVKPQMNGGLGGGIGGGRGSVDNQLGNFMSKTDPGFPNHVPREAFTGSNDRHELGPKVGGFRGMGWH